MVPFGMQTSSIASPLEDVAITYSLPDGAEWYWWAVLTGPYHSACVGMIDLEGERTLSGFTVFPQLLHLPKPHTWVIYLFKGGQTCWERERVQGLSEGSVSLPLSLSLSLSLYVSLCLSLCQFVYLSHFLCLSFSLSLSLCLRCHGGKAHWKVH